MSDGAIFGAIVGVILLGAVLLTTAIFAISAPIAYAVDRSACHSWGRETGREVKMEILTRFVVPIRWDCFTPTGDGRWIPTDRLRDFAEES